MLLPGAAIAQAEAVAEQLRDAVAAPIALDDRFAAVTACFGVAAVDGSSPDVALQAADRAAYAAKRTGRNRVVVHTAELDRPRHTTHQELEALRVRAAQLEVEARIDELTGLPNRRRFNEDLARLDADARRQPAAVLRRLPRPRPLRRPQQARHHPGRRRGAAGGRARLPERAAHRRRRLPPRRRGVRRAAAGHAPEHGPRGRGAHARGARRPRAPARRPSRLHGRDGQRRRVGARRGRPTPTPRPSWRPPTARCCRRRPPGATASSPRGCPPCRAARAERRARRGHRRRARQRAGPRGGARRDRGEPASSSSSTSATCSRGRCPRTRWRWSTRSATASSHVSGNGDRELVAALRRARRGRAGAAARS